MNDASERLARCFLAVVPNLRTEEIRAINVTAWSDVDSWACVTLIAVIDEEFGINLSLDQLWELGTFRAIEQFVVEQRQPSFERGEQAHK